MEMSEKIGEFILVMIILFFMIWVLTFAIIFSIIIAQDHFDFKIRMELVNETNSK